MSRPRLELQSILEDILGSRNVYYQPPTKLSYPCIVYERNDCVSKYSDNLKYHNMTHYTITLIGKKVENDLVVNKLLQLQYCGYNRQFKSDNLYHDVFDLYF